MAWWIIPLGALGAIFALGIVGAVFQTLHQRFPAATQAIMAVLILGYALGMLVMCVNGDVGGPARDWHEELYCPGPPYANC